EAVGDFRRIRGSRNPFRTARHPELPNAGGALTWRPKRQHEPSVRGELHLDIRNGGIMTTLAGESAGELFCRSVELVIRGGSLVSPRGQETREVLDAHLLLVRPRARLVHLPPQRVLNPAFAAAETVWILSGTDEPWIHIYN